MKKIVSLILLLCFLWQSLFQSAILCYWKINQGEIIKTECINRFRPMMHCKGKCYLYRKLKKAADEEATNNKIPQNILKLKGIDECALSDSFWNLNYYPKIIRKTNSSFSKNIVLQEYSLYLFKPPKEMV